MRSQALRHEGKSRKRRAANELGAGSIDDAAELQKPAQLTAFDAHLTGIDDEGGDRTEARDQVLEVAERRQDKAGLRAVDNVDKRMPTPARFLADERLDARGDHSARQGLRVLTAYRQVAQFHVFESLDNGPALGAIGDGRLGPKYRPAAELTQPLPTSSLPRSTLVTLLQRAWASASATYSRSVPDGAKTTSVEARELPDCLEPSARLIEPILIGVNVEQIFGGPRSDRALEVGKRVGGMSFAVDEA